VESTAEGIFFREDEKETTNLSSSSSSSSDERKEQRQLSNVQINCLKLLMKQPLVQKRESSSLPSLNDFYLFLNKQRQQ
jgi:hypothetical protein